MRDMRCAMVSPDTEPHPPASVPRSADCFLGVSRNDIVDLLTGLKVCGCAFRMTKRAVLLQASIPAGTPLVDPALIFAEPSTIVAPEWGADRFPEAFALALTQILEASKIGPVGQAREV